MGIAKNILTSMENASWIRRMFERGAQLKAERGADQVQDLSLGNPVIEPPAAFFEKLTEIAQRREEGLHRYMPNGGFPEVRQAIADQLTEAGLMNTSGKNVIMCVGAGGGLNTFFKTVLDPNDEVIILAPFFVEYLFYIRNHGGNPVVVETNDDFSLNIQAIKNAITERTRCLVVNSPNNPTGVVYSAEQCQSLRDLIQEVNAEREQPVYLVSDEPYREIYFGSEPLSCPATNSPWGVIIYSWSKSLSIPGDRIGYIAINDNCPSKNLINGLTFSTRILGFVNAPAICQLAVESLLNTKVDTSTYKRDRDLIVKSLADAGYECAYPEGAFYVFPKSPIADDVAFCQAASEEGVLLVPGTGFGRPGHFRISYAVENGVVAKAMEKMAAIRENLLRSSAF